MGGWTAAGDQFLFVFVFSTLFLYSVRVNCHLTEGRASVLWKLHQKKENASPFVGGVDSVQLHIEYRQKRQARQEKLNIRLGGCLFLRGVDSGPALFNLIAASI